MSIPFQIAIVTVICLALILTAILTGVFSSPSSARKVILSVTSTNGYASITYASPQHSIKDPTNVTTPWRLTLALTSGDEVFLTAGNPSQTGDITCEISVNSQTWKQEAATYPADKVACAGIIP